MPTLAVGEHVNKTGPVPVVEAQPPPPCKPEALRATIPSFPWEEYNDHDCTRIAKHAEDFISEIQDGLLPYIASVQLIYPSTCEMGISENLTTEALHSMRRQCTEVSNDSDVTTEHRELCRYLEKVVRNYIDLREPPF